MRLRAYVVAAALLLVPATASAGWWDYFDRLSGPGPFGTWKIYWPEVRVAAVHKQSAPNIEEALSADDANALRWIITARFVGMSNEDQAGQTRVDLTTADAALMYRLASFVDVGAGFTYLTFSGPGFETFNRGGLLLPKVTVTPLGFIRTTSPRATAALRSFKVYGDLTWAGHFSATDFQNAVPPFPGDDTVLKRYGFLIDFQTIGYAIFHR